MIRCIERSKVGVNERVIQGYGCSPVAHLSVRGGCLSQCPYISTVLELAGLVAATSIKIIGVLFSMRDIY